MTQPYSIYLYSNTAYALASIFGRHCASGSWKEQSKKYGRYSQTDTQADRTGFSFKNEEFFKTSEKAWE